MVAFSSLFLSTFFSLSYSAPLPSHLLWSMRFFFTFSQCSHSLFYSFFPFIPLILSYLYFCLPVGFSFLPLPTMNWDIRSWMPAFVAPARWLSFSPPPPLSLFPPQLSLYPQPPEYIKTLYLFYLYVNAPHHSSPSPPLPVLCRKCHHLLAVFIFATPVSWKVMWVDVDTEQIMMFYDHSKSPRTFSLLIRFQRVVSLITGIAFIDVIFPGILSY